MTDENETKGTMVTGVIGDDVHVVGIRILEHALREAGFKVVALGVQVSQEEFIDAATETNADAILVSSLSGHAQILAPGLREKCIEAGLNDIRLYLGGQLMIGKTAWEDVEKTFMDMGFNRVYPPGVLPPQIIKDLEADLASKK
ncbi:MAG: methylaspartate mutase subunit S [Deltaproteobacteria bacterium]|nr:methylaspartate mutase subunit S [Deltaproteobacteria bacterium]